MSSAAHDGDQPGLWPLPEAKTSKRPPETTKTAAAPRTPRPAVVRPERRQAGPVEVANLWGIDEVSSYLGVPKHSIYGWRKTGYGPPAVKIGKHLKWRPAAVVEWVRQHERPAG